MIGREIGWKEARLWRRFGGEGLTSAAPEVKNKNVLMHVFDDTEDAAADTGTALLQHFSIPLSRIPGSSREVRLSRRHDDRPRFH